MPLPAIVLDPVMPHPFRNARTSPLTDQVPGNAVAKAPSAASQVGRLYLLLLAIVATPWCAGCGGSPEADANTQATAGGAGSDSGYDSTYDGGEGTESETMPEGSGGAYGGGNYGGGARGGGQNSSYGGGGYSEGGYAGDAGMMAGDAGGYGPSYDGAMEGMMPGYAGGGYAGGEFGGEFGGGNSPQFGMAKQFVNQNCVQCHGPQSSRGDVRLDGLTGNFQDQRNAALWHAVLEQLESGQMPPKAFPRRPDPRQQRTLVSWVKTSLREADFVPLDQQDYLSQAKYAFSTGKESDAVKLAYAHSIAAEDSIAQEVLTQAKWSSVGLRPALTLRFAVGVILDAPESITDLKPLGTAQGGGGGGGSYGGEGFGGAGGAGNNSRQRTYQQLTGALGDALADGFEERWQDGRLGGLFKDIEASSNAAGPSMAGAGYAGGVYSGGGYAGGNFEGGGFDGGFGAGVGGDPSGQAARRPVNPGSYISPGLYFLGTGSQAELLKQAAELGVDGLFVFDVKAEQNRRTQMVSNDTRLRLVNLEGKALAATSTINNIEVERNKMRGIDDDTLDKNTKRFFGMFDEKVRCDNLPPLKPEHAQSRMRQLLVDPDTSDLTKMFEAKLYHSLGLLTADELSMLYQIVLRGNEGLALATGTVDDRRLVLSEVLTQ